VLIVKVVMKKRSIRITLVTVVYHLLAFLIGFSTSPVLADWQYTRWGMKPEEVVEASGNVAVPDPNSKAHSTDSANAVLVAPYTSGRFEFRASFLFDKKSGLLGWVNLSLLDPSLCPNLYGALYSRYGKPESQSKSPFIESSDWRDVQNNNGIALIKIGNQSCSLKYSPLVDKEKKGL
jgi:hypothetical protein